MVPGLTERQFEGLSNAKTSLAASVKCWLINGKQILAGFYEPRGKRLKSVADVSLVRWTGEGTQQRRSLETLKKARAIAPLSRSEIPPRRWYAGTARFRSKSVGIDRNTLFTCVGWWN